MQQLVLEFELPSWQRISEGFVRDHTAVECKVSSWLRATQPCSGCT